MTDLETKYLFELQKYPKYNKEYILPSPTNNKALKTELDSPTKDKYCLFLDISRGSINLNKTTTQLRSTTTIIRVDFEASHTNPIFNKSNIPQEFQEKAKTYSQYTFKKTSTYPLLYTRL